MPVYSLGEQRVRFLSDEFYVAPSADVMGAVTIGHQASLWFNVVVRGDNDHIALADRVNIQDGSVLHTDKGFELSVGAGTSIGHKVMLHGCTVGEGCLIGMNATLLNRVVIGRHSIVGAGSVIPERKTFPERVLILGSPGKVVRETTDEEVEWMKRIAAGYVERAARFRRELAAQA